MNETADPCGELSLRDIAARLDDLLREVRRQGRASVAAQAAAESCLDAVRALEQEQDTGADDRGEEDAAHDRDNLWAAALLPLADALDRVVAQTGAMAERRAEERPRGFLQRWFSGRKAGDPEIAALSGGLRVLRAQLHAVLETFGIEADRRTGIAVDPEIHRIVEVRAPRAGEREGTVLEVIRPAYLSGERVLREAEIVSSKPAPPPT